MKTIDSDERLPAGSHHYAVAKRASGEHPELVMASNYKEAQQKAMVKSEYLRSLGGSKLSAFRLNIGQRNRLENARAEERAVMRELLLSMLSRPADSR